MVVAKLKVERLHIWGKDTIASTASEYPLAKFVIGRIPNP